MNLRMLQHRHIFIHISTITWPIQRYTSQTMEIMGYAAAYTESQLKLTANDITAEVTRAKKAEDTLKSSIQVNADDIKLRVSKGKISSEISAESGSISIKSNRISISSTNFTLTASGYVTMKGASCQGSFEAKNGDWWIKMSYGEITGGYSGSTYGYIDFNGAYNNTNEHTLRIMGNTCVDIKGKLCTATSWNSIHDLHRNAQKNHEYKRHRKRSYRMVVDR